jgi:hypothetical protein
MDNTINETINFIPTTTTTNNNNNNNFNLNNNPKIRN